MLFVLLPTDVQVSHLGSKVSLVGGHGAADPGVVVADLGVDTRLVPLSAAVTPGHHTLELTVAHHGATGVTLTGDTGRN